MFRPAVWHPLTRAWARETAFRRNEQSFWIRVESFGDEQFACVWTVSIGGIDQVHAELDCTPENFQRILSIGGPTPNALPSNAHRAKAKSINGEVAAQIKRRICSHVRCCCRIRSKNHIGFAHQKRRPTC